MSSVLYITKPCSRSVPSAVNVSLYHTLKIAAQKVNAIALLMRLPVKVYPIILTNMRGFSLFFFIFFISFLYVSGQEENSGEEQIAAESEIEEEAELPAPFPLGPVLMIALNGDIAWRPDWSLMIPPDAFVISSGTPVSITLIIDSNEYKMARNKKGTLIEFPVLLNGVLTQVRAGLNAAGQIQHFNIMADILWKIDFIGNKEAPLSLARVTVEETVYFVSLRYDRIGTSETWYDTAGNTIADFTSFAQDVGESKRIRTLVGHYQGEEKTEWYYYDSFGNISEIDSSQGVFSVLYSHHNYPRYWKQQETFGAEELGNTEGNYTLQWDEKGFLLRISGASNEDLLDFRYDYTLDAKGNWTERREIRMIPQLGVLMPSPGLTIKRIIEYGGSRP